MSKRRKKYHKRRSRAKRRINTVDKHHLCYQRRNWRRPGLRALREHWYCKVYLPKNTLHKLIHVYVPDVPAPGEASARIALEQLGYLEKYGAISESDPVERRLQLLAGLFDCVEQPTADAFRKQLQVVREYKKTPP